MPCASRTPRRIRSAAGRGIAELAGRRHSVRIVELRQDQCVDPLRVGRSLDALRKLRPHVLEKRVAHTRELPQVTVVGEHDAGAGEMERVEVRVGNDRVAGVRDPTNVGEKTRRRELGRDGTEIAVERRQRGRAVRERIFRPQGRRIPRLHPEAREVEKRVHHPWAVRLPDEAVVGVEQQTLQRAAAHRRRPGSGTCADRTRACLCRLSSAAPVPEGD